MSTFVKKHPALSLLVLTMIFGDVPALAVAPGLLPPAVLELGVLSVLPVAVLGGT